MPRLPHYLGPIWFAAICALLFACGPAAIPGFVILGVVSAVERVSGRWSRAYVGNKVGELLPTLADTNTPSAVVWPVFPVLVGAPLNHVDPCVEFRRALTSPGGCMDQTPFRNSFAAHFIVQATAAFCSFMNKLRATHDQLIAAIAPTMPAGTSPLVIFGATENDQTAKA